MSFKPQILLYRGLGVIRWQTRGDYGHAALRLRSGEVIEAQFRAGVVVREFDENDGAQAFDVPDLNDEQADLVEKFARDQVGKPYDWLGVLRFISRRPERRWQDSWFCSELVFACFQAGGIDLLRDIQPWKVSPTHIGYSPLIVPAARKLTPTQRDPRLVNFFRDIIKPVIP